MERRTFIQGMSVAAIAAAGVAQQARAQAQSGASAYVTVTDYGATGNGATDDSSAFKSAVAALKAFGGGTLYVPAGNYLLNSTIYIACSNTRIQGVGYESRIINGQSAGAAIQFGDDVNMYYACGVFDLAFGQASNIMAANGNCGIIMFMIGQSWIERCNCQSYPAPLYDGYVFSGCDQLLFSGNEATGCINIGFYWTNNCGDMYIVNTRSDANQFGYQIEDSQGFYITNAAGFMNKSSAWNIVTAGGAGNINLWFTNCLGDTSGAPNWNITNCKVAFFSDCWGSTQISATENAWASGFYLNGPNVTDITFSGGAALINNSHGVAIDGGAARIAFSGFQFGSLRTPGYGNGRGASGGNGLFIGDASDIKVIGSYLSSNNGYGMSNGSGTDVFVSNCSFGGNKLGVISQPPIASCKYKDNFGLNPLSGNVTTPNVPLSGAVITNTTCVDCMIYITGGTVSNIAIDSANTGLSGNNISVLLSAGSTIAITYAAALSWRWIGQ